MSYDEDGPGLSSLTAEELRILQDAALERYREIVLRDINPANRDLGIYRGIRRTIYNWRRMHDFAARIERNCAVFKDIVGLALIDFLSRELEDVRTGTRSSSINCSLQQLLDFADELDLAPDSLPFGFHELFTKY